MSYTLSSNFVPVEWYLAELWPLNLYFCSNFKLSRLFLNVLWYIDLIFGIWLYLDELQLSSNFVPVEWYLAERPERNSNLKCNSSRYSHIPNIKSIYQRTSKKSPVNFKFEQKMGLYLDELQFKFEFGSGRMTFGWVMTLELVFLFKF
jgi:hypothetical protein